MFGGKSIYEVKYILKRTGINKFLKMESYKRWIERLKHLINFYFEKYNELV